MRGSLFHVELELGRGPESPFGNRDHGYDLYLPLRSDGRLDLDQFGPESGRHRVRKRSPDRAAAHGIVKLERDGRLGFEFAGRPSNRQLGFRTPPDRFVVGRVVKIAEDDGETRPFQVIAVRRERLAAGRA